MENIDANQNTESRIVSTEIVADNKDLLLKTAYAKEALLNKLVPISNKLKDK